MYYNNSMADFEEDKIRTLIMFIAKDKCPIPDSRQEPL